MSVRFDLRGWQPDTAEEGLKPPKKGPGSRPGKPNGPSPGACGLHPAAPQQQLQRRWGALQPAAVATQLRRLRLDPDGSNVVMQGDVTRIVSMSARDRRGIIDELAGVALFDSRIEQTRRKLDDVQEREERCRIVEGELETSRTRLERDCQRARLYQDLRQKVQLGRQQERVLQVEQNRAHLQQLAQQQEQLGARRESEQQALIQGQEQLKGAAAELATLQDAVKSLGEDQLIAVQGQLAELEAAGRELQRRAERHQQQASELQQQRHQQQQQRADLQQQSQQLQSTDDAQLRQQADEACRSAEAAVELSRRRLAEVAGRSGSWMEEQQGRSRRRQELQGLLGPQQAEALQLDERLRQEQERQQELQAELAREQQGSGSAAEQLKELQVAQQELLQLIANTSSACRSWPKPSRCSSAPAFALSRSSSSSSGHRPP